MTQAVTTLALSVPREVFMTGGALVGGYLVGALPVAVLVLGARRVRNRGAAPPSTPRMPGGRNPTLELLAEGGLKVAMLTLLLELLKGAFVGLGARIYDDAAWFTAAAIAGCVVGDAFPPGRSGRRGMVPLISGVFAALPGTWAAGTIIALPAIVVLALTGPVYEGVVLVCVPLAFLLGTHDLRTLPPAALIVVAILSRNRMRRRAQERAVSEWRASRTGGLVVDQPPRR